MHLFDLQGEIALVTGAGSGIGQRIAIGLAEAGADVACFDLPRQSDGLEATVERIRTLGKRAIVQSGDVTNASDLARTVAEVEQRLGSLSIGMNCAGVADAAPAEDMAYDQWRRVHAINVDGVFLSCQAQARAMLPRKKGAIVNIASMSGSIVNRGLLQAHYNSSKAAVIHMSKSLAMEWSGSGVRVNTISPGYTATPMNLRPEVAEQVKVFERDTPLGRMANVDEMVGPAVFLVSRAASFCTGIDLIIDGGFVCW